MGTFFPEARRTFVEFLPEAERGDLLGNYYRRLTDPDPSIHHPAAATWSRYESVCSNLIPRREDPATPVNGSQGAALALARLEAHYFVNGIFLRPNELLDAIDRLHGIPAILIQGRYDMVCPIAAADALARAWPGSRYIIVPDAGHSAMEPGIRAALVRATEMMKVR